MVGGSVVRVLGDIAVLVDGEPIDLGGRKQRQAFGALLIERNRTVSVDRLVEWLWGADPPAKPLVSLRAYVSNLRKLLEGSGIEVEGLPGSYQLVCGDELIDAFHVDRLITEASSALRQSHIDRASALVDEALALIDGDPFADLRYDEFAQHEIARLDELVTSARELQAMVAVEKGDDAGALPMLAELVEAHPLREQLRAAQMRALYRVGRQAEALRSYSSFRERLVDELGVDPTPELQALEGKILRHESLTDSSVEQSVAKQRTSLTLVGREAELDRLLASAADAPSVVVMVGEAGAGKSTLMAALLQQLRDQGWRTCATYCPEGDGVPPLWPFRHALRDLGRADAVAFDRGTDASRFDLLDAIVTEVLDSARAEPTVLAIDDVHWADDDTLLVVDHLSRRISDEPLVLVCAARSLPDRLAAVAADVIDLPPLGPEAVADIVETITGNPLDHDHAAILAERTAGNAFYVSALANLARTEGRLLDAGGPVPPVVSGVVRQRVAALAPETAALLELAALAPHSVGIEVLAKAADLSPEEVRTRLAPAHDAGIIVADPDDRHHRVRFDHALIRETLCDQADAEATRARHGALALGLEHAESGRLDRVAADIARHHALSLPDGDAEAALRWAVRAADVAESGWFHSEALRNVARALDVLDRMDEPDPRRRAELLIRLGWYGRVVGQAEQAEAALLEAFRIADQLDDADLLAETALTLSEGLGSGLTRWFWIPGPVAITALERALDRVGQTPSATRANLLSRLSADSYGRLDVVEQTRLLDEAETIAGQVGDVELTAKTLRSRAWTVGWASTSDERIDRARSLVELTNKAGLGEEEPHARAELISALLSAGRRTEAEAEAASLGAEAALRGSLTWRFFALQWELCLLQMKGDWPGVYRAADKAMSDAAGFGNDFSSSIESQRAAAMLFAGDIDPIESMLRARTTGSRRYMYARLLLHLLVVNGRLVDAEQALEIVDVDSPDPDQKGGRCSSAAMLEAFADLRHLDRVEQLIDFVEPLSGDLVLTSPGLGGFLFFGPFDYYLARGLIALGRLDEARVKITAGRELMVALDSRPHLLQLDLADGLLLQADGDLSAAQEILDRARRDALAIGMKPLAGQAQRAILAET